MTLHAPIWLQPAGGDPDITYSARELRQLVRNLVGAAVQALDTQGVVGSSAFQVTQRGAGANFSVDVAAGGAFVVGDDVASQGTYFAWNDGTVNVAVPAAPASGTEVHRLVLQIQDKLNNGVWTGYTAALTLLADTGSGTPAEPNSALTLALISAAAGQASILNANITNQPLVFGAAPSDWVNVGMSSGWTYYAGRTWVARQVTLDGHPCVMTSGQIAPGNTANGTKIASFGPGYRPLNHPEGIPTGNGNGIISSYIEVQPNGDVICEGVGNPSHLVINGIIPLDAP